MLDIDPRHGGLASLEALKKRRPLPRGPQVLTGGGGQHLYFAHPGGSVANSSGRLGDGLDVRGDGGYVVAPPSLHMTGNSYKWLRPLNGALPNAGDLFTAEGPSGSSAVVDDVIPQGTRRTSMLRVAGALKRRGLSGDEILPTLAQLNRRCRPPLDEAELRTIAYPSTIAADPASSTPFVPGRLAATPITEIQMRSIEWLERPLWQRSAFQLLAGAKGAGKGTYLAGFAARISRDANVLFVSSEDSTEIDLKPRLVAAGADIGRCFVIQQHVQLPEDVTDLRLLAESLGGVGLLVIDPVANHIGDSNSNSEAEVRHAIAPLNPLANDLDSLVIGVRHPGKDNTRGALASILGSTAWTATPRSAVMIVPDDEDPQLRHIQVVAGNRSLNGSAQQFRIEAVDVPGLTEPITRAVDLGASMKNVDDLLAATTNNPSRTQNATELILDILEAEGSQESDTLDARVARETGISAKTVKNTRSKLSDKGLIKNLPDKDDTGAIVRWGVHRTQAPRS